MNIWLHKAVMREPAKSGWKVPASPLDELGVHKRIGKLGDVKHVP